MSSHRNDFGVKKMKGRSALALLIVLVSMTASASVARAFDLSSPDIVAGRAMPDKFTFKGMGCNGENISPGLTWNDPPPDTKSFALMVHDPDANTGGAGIWHWVVVNIPASSRALAQGAGDKDGTALPAGSRQINNDYLGMTGSPAWGGPCPPKGQKAHTYNFTLYALNVGELHLPPNATASQAGFLINLNAIGQARLSVPYSRAP